MAKNYTLSQVIQQQFSDDELLAVLPAVVVEFAELIGLKKSLLLAEKLGGIDMYIPHTSKVSNYEQRLIDVVGDVGAKKIMQRFKGERVYIPRCDNVLREARNQKFCDCVKKAVAMNMSQTKAIQVFAYEFGFSERFAYVVLKRQQIAKKKPNKNN